jgi:single-stranded-DNA-specific exonuclease
MARGFVEQADRAAFENPTLAGLHHPSTLPGASEAAIRLVEAVRSGRSIAIFGDYDVDGIMSSAILHHVITLMDPECTPRLYVPHRVDEGYGLNVGAIERLAEEGVDLIISVDCGITAFAECARARELGVELIITDHHAFARDADGAVELPEPDLLVHPMRPDAPAPFTDLCGAGVVLKLAWAFLERWCNSKRLWDSQRALLLEMFSFAALATIADVVPLVDENRIIVSHGLKIMPQNTKTGLKALIDACGFNKPDVSIQASDVGFRIAPVLNAAGRLGSAEEALALVTTADGPQSADIAANLVKLNRQRQDLCKKTTEHAVELVEAEGFDASDRRAIVLAHEDWNPGLIGICCSRLAEQFGRPVVLMNKDGSSCRGSARSVPGFSVHEALVRCATVMNTDEEILVFGGHHAAAGMTVPQDRFEEFVDLFVGVANEGIRSEDLVPAIEFDARADLRELELTLVRRMERMAPFGAGNPHPRLVLEGVTISNPVRMGGGGQHLRARVSSDGRSIGAVWWRVPDILENLVDVSRREQRIDLVVEPRINRWQGREDVQLEIKDVRVHEGAPLATA